MKNFEIDGITYSIAEKWEELTLAQYIKLSDLGDQEEELLKDEVLVSNIDLNVPGTEIPFSPYTATVLSILSNCDEMMFGKITFPEYVKLLPIFTSFLSEQPDFQSVKEFTINNIKYKLEPYNELSLGAVTAIHDYMMLNNNKPDIGHLVSILYRPCKGELDGERGTWVETIEEFDTKNLEYRTQLFLKQPVGLLAGAAVFFLNGRQELPKYIQTCISKRQKLPMDEKEKALLSNLTQNLTRLQ